MSEYYRPQRSRNRYDPKDATPYRVSRSKLDLYLNCPRCFYIDRRLGVGTPPGFPFNLNSAVDALLKKEFDFYRAQKKPHPLFLKCGIDAIPFEHPDLEVWRDSLRRGIQYAVPDTRLVLTGGVDDVWIDNQSQELIIADYKATAKNGQVSLDADWQIGYKRQAEVYQYLFRSNGFKVSNTAYFVYCNGRTDRDRFDQRLEFDISMIPYTGNADWVQASVVAAYRCLESDQVPAKSADCDYCQYTSALDAVLSTADR